MKPYTAPVDEYLFLLERVFRIRDCGLSLGEDFSADVTEAMLREAARFAEEVLQPLNAGGDRFGCIFNPDGSVTTPPGFKDAYDQLQEAGWNTLAAPVSAGGMGAPAVLAAGVEEFFNGGNQSFTMYTGWGFYAGAMLEAFGSDYLKSTYLPRLVSGEWNGTMALTEPHCGTDLGLLKTRADENGDGSWRITGTKIFNSGGEHDLNDNIIHFVLARADDAPAGTAGISLFLVPKFTVDPASGAMVRNTVDCTGVEHKMGLRGSATCTMQFDGAKGWLIGELHRGLAVMFIIMNHTRRSIGICGVGVAEAAIQRARAYAAERLQGKALTADLRGSGVADPLLVHPDVRRMLLTATANLGAARALLVWTALQGDIAERSADPAERESAGLLIGLLTPIAKAFVSDISFATTIDAQQVFGGHGYVTDNGMDQYIRDSRILMLAEGANGVQAFDLAMRKVQKDGGRAIELLLAQMAECAAAHDDPGQAAAMGAAIADVRAATAALMAYSPDQVGAVSYAYLQLVGTATFGFMWLKMLSTIAAEPDNAAALHWQYKRVAARFYLEQILPATALLRRRVETDCDYIMRLPNEAF